MRYSTNRNRFYSSQNGLFGLARVCCNTLPVYIYHALHSYSLTGIPTDAYYAIEEVHDDGTPTSKAFNHVSSEIGAEEAEEVGVEHLLRDIRDTTIGSLSQSVSSQLQSVKGLMTHTQHVEKYLTKVVSSIRHNIYLYTDERVTLHFNLSNPTVCSYPN